MNSKDIILNETEEPIGQQVLNITDLFINKTKKEYETKNLDIEKCNFDYYKKYTKKSNIFFFSLKNSDEYESNTGFKNLIFPQQNANMNNLLKSNNSYQSKKDLIRIQKNQREEVKKEEEKEDEKEIYKGRILGRKRKDSFREVEHDKYAIDNQIKKVKSNLLHFLLKFINSKIKEKYKGKSKVDLLKKLGQKEFIISNVDSDKCFLKQKIKNIFSKNISTKYKKYKSDHNEKLILKILNEKKESFEKLFNLSFLDCLEHFRGTKRFPELDGMITLEIYKEKFNNDTNYLDTLKYLIMNYEDMISRRVRRNKKSKN